MLAKQVVYILCLDDIPTTFLLYLEFFSLANETQFSAVTSLSLQSLKQWRIRKSIHFPNEKKKNTCGRRKTERNRCSQTI